MRGLRLAVKLMQIARRHGPAYLTGPVGGAW
jgi:hypothetical protein